MQTHLKHFGDYLLVDRLAEGGMGEIFRARKVSSGPKDPLWAVKIIRRPEGSESDSALTNSEAIRMFRSEAEVLRRLRHPNIIRLEDYGAVQGQAYIAMELLHGKSVREITLRARERDERIPLVISAWLTYQIAQALSFAHRYRDQATGRSMCIIHRDVSPQNILVSYDGAAKLIDFGIAKLLGGPDQTRSGILKGKPSYLSPEQLNSEVLDERCDIFNLGIVLWECLTGQKLFKGNSPLEIISGIAQCDKTVPPPSRINPAVPHSLDAVVLKALSKNRQDRYPSANAFAAEINRVCEQLWSHWQKNAPFTTETFLRSRFEAEIKEEQNINETMNEISKNVMYASPAVHSPDQMNDGLEIQDKSDQDVIIPLRVIKNDSAEKSHPGKSETGAFFRKPMINLTIDPGAAASLQMESSTISVAPPSISRASRSATYRQSYQAIGAGFSKPSKGRRSSSSTGRGRHKSSNGRHRGPPKQSIWINFQLFVAACGVLFLGASLVGLPSAAVKKQLWSLFHQKTEVFLQLSREASK